MKTNCPRSVALPTVEECRESAMVVTEELLRMCVRQQCNDIKVICSDATRRECFEDGQMMGATNLAITKFSASEVHPEDSGAGDGVRPEAVMEMQDIQYNGKLLAGRLLISAKQGKVRLDKRLIAMIDVSVDAIFECNTGMPVEFMMIDILAPRAREGDLLVLERGYWYGKWIRFPLFSEHITDGPGPECIDADLSLLSFEGRPLGTLRVRAEQAPSPAADGGTEAPPSTDAGSPRQE